MKKIFLVSIALFCLSFLCAPIACAQEKDSNAVVEQLCSELEKEGACTAEDLKPMKKSLKSMVDRGTSQRDLKRTIRNLSNKGVAGKDLKKTIDSMNSLVRDGEDPQEAGNVVSLAVHQAFLGGLKGKELADRVHEAIRQRKQERQQQKLERWKEKLGFKKQKKEVVTEKKAE